MWSTGTRTSYVTTPQRRSGSQVGKKLRELVPNLRDGRVSCGMVRQRSYLFPPLAECRSRFEAVLGQRVDWPAEPDGRDAADLVNRMWTDADDEVQF